MHQTFWKELVGTKSIIITTTTIITMAKENISMVVESKSSRQKTNCSPIQVLNSFDLRLALIFGVTAERLDFSIPK